MDSYVNEILFKQRVSSIKPVTDLDIDTLVLFNKQILDRIIKKPNIRYEDKLSKFESHIIQPLRVVNSNKLFEKLLLILNTEFDIIKDDMEYNDIYNLFTEAITNYCEMCIRYKDFDIEKANWSEILNCKQWCYTYMCQVFIINTLILKGKKLDMMLFLNYDNPIYNYQPFREYKDIITVDNIPDVIDNEACQYIKNKLTLKYIDHGDKISGLFLNVPVIGYKLDNDIPVLTDNSKLKVIIKILFNCKSLVLISDYLKEQPIFDQYIQIFGEDDDEADSEYIETNIAIYNLQKEEFKRLLRKELKIRADTNTREYIRLKKIIEQHTHKTDIVPVKNINSYEKKLKQVIDDKFVSKS